MNNPQLRRPSDESLQRFLDAQRGLVFTYESVGGTAPRGELPAGYAVDRLSVELGRGGELFEAARRGIEAWTQFDLGWCEAWPRESPIRSGEVVAVVARSLGLWWTNATRIAYVVDEGGEETLSSDLPLRSGIPPLAPPFEGEGSRARFGFAYGTLPGHVEMGEELFLVEWDRVTDAVNYSILAFSRPRHPLARIGRPLVRRLQRRFREDSAAAMLRYVKNAAQSTKRG
ncbi:MAG: DUF1990 domain-containing protein [Pirellula sp.]|nr:DUF1990 domain-containing protein [Pirellula sp.]